MSETVDVPATTGGNNKSYVANPRAPKGDTIDEPTGTITSDSLASESIRSGGAFNENAKAGISSVRGSNSTLTNEDTSSAREYSAATDRESRDGDRFTTSPQYPDPRPANRPVFDGTHTAEGYTGGPTSSKSKGGAYDTSKSSADDGDAPTYADNVTGSLRSEGELRPKGRDLVEDDDLPAHRSTFVGDVGGPNDPGRVAEQKIFRTNAGAGGDAGYEKDGAGRVDSGNEYGALNPKEDA